MSGLKQKKERTKKKDLATLKSLDTFLTSLINESEEYLNYLNEEKRFLPVTGKTARFKRFKTDSENSAN